MSKRKLIVDQQIESTNRKVEEFLKTKPKFRTFLCDYMEKEEEKIKNKHEKWKTELFENAKKYFDFDVENIRKNVFLDLNTNSSC